MCDILTQNMHVLHKRFPKTQDTKPHAWRTVLTCPGRPCSRVLEDHAHVCEREKQSLLPEGLLTTMCYRQYAPLSLLQTCAIQLL